MQRVHRAAAVVHRCPDLEGVRGNPARVAAHALRVGAGRARERGPDPRPRRRPLPGAGAHLPPEEAVVQVPGVVVVGPVRRREVRSPIGVDVRRHVSQQDVRVGLVVPQRRAQHRRREERRQAVAQFRRRVDVGVPRRRIGRGEVPEEEEDDARIPRAHRRRMTVGGDEGEGDHGERHEVDARGGRTR